MNKKQRFVCGLDIGTTKICMLIARVHDDGGLEAVGTGYAESAGLRKGIVVDLEEAAASIRKAAEEAEVQSGVSADWVTVGISGDHIQSFNCHGATSIGGKNNEVTPEDVIQVVHAARSIPVPPGREIIHVLAQEFFLDNRGGIQNPVGLSGLRLDANVHVVTCEEALKQNLITAVNHAQMRVKKVILQQLASAEAVVTRDEKELGVAVVDIGGGTTDIAAFMNHSILFTAILPVGGGHFTRDLAIELRTPLEHAETIKKQHGAAVAEGIAQDEMIDVPGVAFRGSRPIPREMICKILYMRAAEVLEIVRDHIERAGNKDQLIAGAILTGGGAMLNGMLPLAEKILEMPVRHGLPSGMRGITDELSHPVYATAIGLAMHALKDENETRKSSPKTSSMPWFLNRFLSWVGN